MTVAADLAAASVLPIMTGSTFVTVVLPGGPGAVLASASQSPPPTGATGRATRDLQTGGITVVVPANTNAPRAAASTVETVVLSTTPSSLSTAAVVEPARDVSTGSMTNLALISAPVDEDLTALLEDDASSVPVDHGIAQVHVHAHPPEAFDSVTAVESPDGFLLALMRTDGRASPAALDATVSSSSSRAAPTTPEPFAQRFGQPLQQMQMHPTQTMPAATPIPVQAIPPIQLLPRPVLPMESAESMQPVPLTESMLPSAAPLALAASPNDGDVDVDVDVGGPAATAVPAAPAANATAMATAGTLRRSRRWVAAGAFALLLCATAATAMLVRRPVTAVAPSSSFAPAHESPVVTAVATAHDPSPPFVAASKQPPVPTVAPAPQKPQQSQQPQLQPALAKPKSRARPTSVERPRPVTRQPVRRPVAPRKCKDLRCL